ncbi:MAG: MAPEG family protein [Pseudomonadota bacterium]
MNSELNVLALAALLQTAHFVVVATGTHIELPAGKPLGPRDPDKLGGHLRDLVSRRTGRIIRAWENHFESLALYTIATVVVTLADASTPFTAACAWAYLTARVLYIPAYILGLVPWRSLIWTVGFAAPALILIATLASSG